MNSYDISVHLRNAELFFAGVRANSDMLAKERVRETLRRAIENDANWKVTQSYDD